jgi:hypothetical protein
MPGNHLRARQPGVTSSATTSAKVRLPTGDIIRWLLRSGCAAPWALSSPDSIHMGHSRGGLCSRFGVQLLGPATGPELCGTASASLLHPIHQTGHIHSVARNVFGT